jgi:hypothetical protein
MENIFLISFRNNFSKRAKEEKLYKILQFDYPKKRGKNEICVYSPLREREIWKIKEKCMYKRGKEGERFRKSQSIKNVSC